MDIIEIEKRLLNYKGDDRVVKSTEIREQLATRKDPFSFQSKIPSLDLWLEGFEVGELVVISGPTGFGKTTLAQTLSFNFFTQDVSSLWFSYEMTYRQFLKKIPEELFIYMPLVLQGKSLSWIGERIHEAKIKYNTKAVFIDHLHFLIDMVKMKNTSLEIGSIIRGLKQTALKLHVTIFIIAHSTKIRFDQEPGIDTIRDSSLIPQDSDIVLIIWRPKDNLGEYTNTSIVKVDKSRRTGIIGKKVSLIHQFGLFWERVNEPTT